ncbi:MAG: putative capsid assembly protease C [Prokaryotic dsDNA virus sp.]|nr:MAG: putative capsid assembly protease C [Prokaryotic dsDNA virus sp.]|tara:strand:+ start:31787 stop:33067 length:1281 start_codon:yes stop_codon:yes gene_type:complete
MAHEVPRISREMVFNTPHLIAQDQFSSVINYLEDRPNGLMTKEELSLARDLREEKKKLNLGETDVAVIEVSGALTYRETLFGALCGMSSYEGILSQMRKAAKEGYEVVVLNVDSGGGQAYRAFETAQDLRRIADENNIKLIAYVDGISASAAYALSVSADEIIINPYAEVGSIGVLTRLVNTSEMEKKEGIETTYVYAGGQKIPFDAEGKWTESFLKDLQQKVDNLYADFVSHVAELRGVSEESVRSTEAKMFGSKEALELSLADKVMGGDEFANYLADLVNGTEDTKPMNTTDTTKEEQMSDNTEKPSVDMSEFEKLQAQMAQMAEQNEALAAELNKNKLGKVEEALAEFSFIENGSELAQILFGMKSEDKDVVMSVLQKAQTALEATTTESLTTDEEPEEPLSVKAGSKEATRAYLEQLTNKAK